MARCRPGPCREAAGSSPTGRRAACWSVARAAWSWWWSSSAARPDVRSWWCASGTRPTAAGSRRRTWPSRSRTEAHHPWRRCHPDRRPAGAGPGRGHRGSASWSRSTRRTRCPCDRPPRRPGPRGRRTPRRSSPSGSRTACARRRPRGCWDPEWVSGGPARSAARRRSCPAGSRPGPARRWWPSSALICSLRPATLPATVPNARAAAGPVLPNWSSMRGAARRRVVETASRSSEPARHSW